LEVKITFDKSFEMDDFTNSLTDSHHICSLIDKQDSSKFIRPKTTVVEGDDTLSLLFDFRTISKDDTKGGECYKIGCSTQKTKNEEFIFPIELDTSYCF